MTETPASENARRAQQAYTAIEVGTDFGIEPESELETYCGDMIANIRHLCRLHGFNWEGVLAKADKYFEAEVAEEE